MIHILIYVCVSMSVYGYHMTTKIKLWKGPFPITVYLYSLEIPIVKSRSARTHTHTLVHTHDIIEPKYDATYFVHIYMRLGYKTLCFAVQLEKNFCFP